MTSKGAARTLNEIVTIGAVLDEATYDALAAALDEAVEHGAMMDKYGYNLDAHNNGRDEILSRLRNPDETLVEVFRTAEDDYWEGATDRKTWEGSVEAICRALANVLEKGKTDD